MSLYIDILFFLFIILLAHTYFIYPAILFGVSRIARDTASASSANLDNEYPTISIVIAAYNEEKVIEEKVQNCLNLKYPKEKVEIWVGSDGSGDGTNYIVEELSKKHDNLNFIALPRMGKNNVINKIVPLTENQLLVFSDANTEFKDNALKKLVKHFFDPKVGCVCGKLVYRNPNEVVSGQGEGFYWKYETKLKKLESVVGYIAGANGAIYCVKKNLFTCLPPKTINDDFYVSMKVVEKGYKSLYEEEALAYEDVAPTVHSEFKRHIRDGAGHYIAIKQFWRLLNPFWGFRSFIYISHRLLRWLAPFLMILIFLISAKKFDQPFYTIMLYLQTVFYLLALSSFPLRLLKIKKLPFFVMIPFYFCNLNLALLLGFLKSITGNQKNTWESTAR